MLGVIRCYNGVMLEDFIDLGSGFGLFYIISQIFALTGLIFNLYAIQRRRKVQILNYGVVGTVCVALHYVFLGAWSGVAVKMVNVARNATAAYGTVHKWKALKILPVVFVGFYILSALLTYESPFSLLPAMGTSIYTLAVYLGSARRLRYAAGVGSILYLIYNIHVFSVVGILSEVIFTIDTLVAIWRYRGKKRKKKK